MTLDRIIRPQLEANKQFAAGAYLVSPSSRGLGHRPFTAVTGVRTPLGMPYSRRKAAH